MARSLQTGLGGNYVLILQQDDNGSQEGKWKRVGRCIGNSGDRRVQNESQ